MKYLIAILAVFVCGHAVACDIHYSAENVVLHEIVKHGMDIPTYDILCGKLKAAGAELNVQVWNGKDGRRRIAVAMVSVTNVEQSAMSSLYTKAARFADVGAQSKDDLVYATIVDAIKELMVDKQIDVALAEMKASEREHRLADAALDRFQSRKPKASGRAK